MVLFPENHAVLVMGEASTGLFEFCCYLGTTYLKNGEKVVFVENNAPPAQVRRLMSRFGVDASEFESDGHLVIVDATGSPSVEEESLVFKIESPHILPYIFEAVTKSIDRVGGKPARVLFDSLTPLYISEEPQAVGRFFRDLATICRFNGTLTAVIHKGMLDEDQIALVAGLADGLLEMKVDNDFKRYIRINHLKGTAVTPKWVPFEFETDEDEAGDATVLSWGRKGSS